METKEKQLKGKWDVTRRDFLKLTGAAGVGIAGGGLLDLSLKKPAWAQTPTGTINVVSSADADTFDPHTWISGDGFWIGHHVFQQLVTLDEKPMLAQSWENPDSLTWIFHLKKGVEFSNGEPFDASVVKFNFERILNPEVKSSYRGLLAPIEAVDAMDKHTVKVKSKTPFGVLLSVLSLAPMVSPRALKELGKDFPRKPIGTGPFLMKEWVPMEKVVLEANPGYHGDKAKVKNILWRPISEPSTRIVELRSGKADLINKVPPELAGEISAGRDLELLRKRGWWKVGIKLNIAKPPFDKVKVRQAFNYAVDKEIIIKSILNGAGYTLTDFTGPDREGHNPDLKPYPHDPEKAKKLLAEAGYPNGVEIEILTSMGRFLKDKEVVEAVSYQVKDAGFSMKVVAKEWGMFLRTYRDYNGFVLGTDSPTHRLFFHEAYAPGKSYSWMGYNNEEFNKLYEEAQATYDPPKRNAIYQKMNAILWDECPSLYLYLAQDIYGISKRLKGFSPRPDQYILLHDAYLV